MSNLNPKQFGDYELRHSTEDTGSSKPSNLIGAYHQGERVGYMHWLGTDGRVLHVDVDDAHQRKGLATAMWEHANSLPGVRKPKHSEDRTNAGDAWARTVGGRLPRRLK